MKWFRTIALLVFLVCAAVAVAAAIGAARTPAKAADGECVPSVVGEVDASGLFRHTGTYPPLAVTWRPDGRIRRAVGVFPHPALPMRVILATGEGLLVSDDAGGTWTPLAQARPEQAGIVRHVAFAPDAPDTFYLASDHKGVWATADGGKTFRQAGSRAAGMASEDCVGVYVYPGDRRFHTLLAIHGEAAPGVSVTRDDGRTWRVAGADYLVREVLCGNAGDEELFLAAARKKAPDLFSIYYSISIDDYWMEIVRDVVPTGGALSLLVKPDNWSEEVFRGAHPFYATADSGLYRVTKAGSARVGPASAAFFSSVGVAWGPHADTQIVYAYEPRKLGMVFSTDEMATSSTASAGLFAGAFVREGAHIRASANGAVFYAVVNDALYVGWREAGPLAVRQAAVAPPVFSLESEGFRSVMDGLREELRTLPTARSAAAEAKRLLAKTREAQAFLAGTRVALTAKVTAPAGAVPSVTADLSRVGGSGLTPMYDDGRHGDGGAGDGVYGTTFRLDPRHFKNDTRDWRRRWPGRMGLTVSAALPDGTLAGTVAVLSIFDRLESFSVGQRADRIVVKGEPWTKHYGIGYYATRDISDYYGLSFWIMASGAAEEEVFVQLHDLPPYSPSMTTPPLGLMKEGLVEGGKIAGEWRRVVVPLKRFLKDAPQFQTPRWLNVILSGEGKSPVTYSMEDMRFLLTAEEAKTPKGAKPR